MKHRFLIFVICLLNAGRAFAAGEVSETGRTGLSFLRVVPSAAITSLGGGGSASFTGTSSQWSNPALLSLIETRTVEFTHTEWIADIRQEYAAFASKLGGGSAGAAVQLFDSGDIAGFDLNASPTSDYSIRNVALSFAYARPIGGGLSVGGAYKRLFQKVSMETAGGYAVDAGLYYQAALDGLSLAAVARNYGRMGKLKAERTDPPSDVALGFRYDAPAPVFGIPYRIAGDYLIPKYGDNGVRAGIEIEPFELLVLRAGYRSDSDIEDFSVGLGLILERFSADISFTPMSEGFENALRFTLGLRDF